MFYWLTSPSVTGNLIKPHELILWLIVGLITMADLEKVSQLVELGLNHDDAMAALIKTGFNLERAIALIFEEPTSIKAADSGTIFSLIIDQDMQEAIAKSLDGNTLNKVSFSGFSRNMTDILKNPDEPVAMEVLKEWPLLSYVLLALAEVDGLSEVLSEANNASVWSKNKKLDEKESLAFELLENFKEQQMSDKKYGSPSTIGNYLVSKGNASFPCSLTGNMMYLIFIETLDVLRNVLIRESSDEKASKLKRILAIPIIRESISSTIDYISALELSPFHHDEDLRLWLSKSLEAPKTFLFPKESCQKLMILSFPQLANIRIPLELYIDRHLKKNSVIMGPKERELQEREQALDKITSKKHDISVSSISDLISFFQKHPSLTSETVLTKLIEYKSSQISKIQDLDSESLSIRRRISDIFEVSALLKENVQLFGICTLECLYLLKSNSWWKFSDKNVLKVDEDSVLIVGNISSLWYKSN